MQQSVPSRHNIQNFNKRISMKICPILVAICARLMLDNMKCAEQHTETLSEVLWLVYECDFRTVPSRHVLVFRRVTFSFSQNIKASFVLIKT